MRITLLLLCGLLSFSAFADFRDDQDSAKKSRKPWIQIIRLKDNQMVLYVKNNFFFPKRVLGEYEVQPDGLQFTPFAQAPDNIPQKSFVKFYRNDDLNIGPIFIPYSSMKKVRKPYYVKITTDGGKKYTFSTNHAKKRVNELQARFDD